MKKFLLIVISLTLLLLSTILGYHIVSDEPMKFNQSDENLDPVAEISSEIDSLVLDENYEIEIGEMV